MKDFWKKLIEVMGLFFGVLVIGFTGFQTWMLLYSVSGDAIVATLGLTLFEGGMLYWWTVFQKSSEGLPQMVISALMAVFGLILVSTSTALHLGAIEATMLGVNTPARLVTVAAILNLLGKFAFPLVAPSVLGDIYSRTMEGKIMAQAYKVFDANTDKIAGEVADRMAAVWVENMAAKLLTANLAANLPQTPMIEGKLDPVPTDALAQTVGAPTTNKRPSPPTPPTIREPEPVHISANGTGPKTAVVGDDFLAK